MPNAKTAVEQAQKLILASELKDLLLPLWRLIEWQIHPESTGTGVALDCKGDAVIHIYPQLASEAVAPLKVLREFGKFVLLRSGDRGRAIWNNKLDMPTKEQIATVKEKLADPELRKTCKQFKDVLDTYPSTGGSVNKLVFINVTNALLGNNIAYADSVNVDIMAWGPTHEYCNQKKYHSLIPLASAYCPYEVYNDFGSALAAMVVDKLANVRDSSVAFALRGIIQRIAKIASPE